jgi:hypothetical protein
MKKKGTLPFAPTLAQNFMDLIAVETAVSPGKMPEVGDLEDFHHPLVDPVSQLLNS